MGRGPVRSWSVVFSKTMSRLILTHEEREENNWLKLPDKALADIVRHCALIYKKKEDAGNKPALMAAAMHICVVAAMECNSDRSTWTMEGLTYDDTELGNYRLTVEKLDENGNPVEI